MAFFNVSESDLAQREAKLGAAGLSIDEIDYLKTNHFPLLAAGCRRQIKEPEILLANTRAVNAQFADIRDAKTGLPLFSDKVSVVCKNNTVGVHGQYLYYI